MKSIYSPKNLLMIFVQVLLVFSVSAQSSELGQLYAKKNELVKQKEYKQALIWAKKMLVLAAKEFGNEASTYANYANDVGQLFLINKEYAQAIKLFTQASNIYKKELGEKHMYYGVGLNSLANVYYEQKKYTKALPIYQQVLGIYKEQLGTKHQYYIVTIDQVATIYEQQKNYAALLSLLRERLELYELEKGSQHGDYAYQLGEIARIYKAQKKYAKAAGFYERSAKIFGKNKAYENQAATLSNLSTVYLLMKNFKKSASISHESLNIFKNKLKDTQSVSYAAALSGLIHAYEYQKDTQRLISSYQELLPLLEQQKNFNDYISYAYNLGSNYQGKNQLKDAHKWYEKVVKIAKEYKLQTLDLIKAMTNLAVIKVTYALYPEAEKLLKEGLLLHAKNYGKNKRSYYALLTTLGELYRSLAKYSLAEKNFIEAQMVAEKVLGKQSKEYNNIYNSLGLLYKDTGQYVKGKQNLEIAEKYYQNKPDYGTVLNNLGLLYMAQGLYEKAEKVFLKALNQHAKTLGVLHYEYATVLNNLGLLYFNTGVYSKALPRYKQALKIKQHHYGKMHPYYANSLGNLGLVHFNTGNYAEAEQAFDEAMNIYRKTVGEEHNFYAKSLLNWASLYTALGKYKQAVATLQKAEKVIIKSVGESHALYASFLAQVGKFYLTVKNFETAGDYFYTEMELYKKLFGANHPNYFIALLNLHFAYKAQGKRAIVEKYFKNIIPLAEKALKDDPTIFAHILRNKAFDYQDLGKYEEAEALLKRGTQIIAKSLGTNNQTYVQAQGQNAIFYAKIGKNALAEVQFIQFANLYLQYMARNYPSMSERDKLSFHYASIEYIEAFKHFAINQGTKSPALLDKLLEFHLKTKLLALNFSKKMRATILRRKDKGDLKLYNQWIAQKEYLAKLYRLPKSLLQKRGINLMELETKNDQIEKQLAKKYKLFSQQVFVPKYSWKKIQKSLKPNEVVIEVVRAFGVYKGSKVIYGIWIIKGGKQAAPSFVKLQNGKELEQRYLKYYRGRIKYKGKDKYSYNKFWKPIQDALDQLPESDQVQHVFFSSTGFYTQVNPNTLQNPVSKKYLIDRYKIKMINTTKDVLKLRKKDVLGANALTVLVGRPVYKLSLKSGAQDSIQVGNRRSISSDRSLQQLTDIKFDDLPGTEEEVNQIESIVQQNDWETQKLVGEEALEERIKAVKNPAILHIATHGFFISTKPQKMNSFLLIENDVDYHEPMLRSGIVLTGVSNQKELLSSKDDGILTAYEVANMRLENTQLVVLSACETGLGDVRLGEGVYGLQRALKLAGAKNIIMSLWKVDDTATQKLMVSFYNNLIKFNDIAKAFRAAQQEVKKEFPHPYYWGAFILLGE